MILEKKGYLVKNKLNHELAAAAKNILPCEPELVVEIIHKYTLFLIPPPPKAAGGPEYFIPQTG